MSHFHTLTIEDVRRETRDAVSLAFHVPESLKDTFRFTQGQYLTLRHRIAGEEVRRSYSICNGVHDEELRVAIKQVPDGAFSTFANTSLKVGDSLEVMPPQGRFNVPLDAHRQGRYLAVAAGSGITPILSIISTTLALEPESRFTLVYGNRTTAATLFRTQLQDLKDRYLERLNLIYVFSREEQDVALYNGRIDSNKCRQLFGRWLQVGELDAAFLCGPQEMTGCGAGVTDGAGHGATRYPPRAVRHRPAYGGTTTHAAHLAPPVRRLRPDQGNQRRPHPRVRHVTGRREHPRRRQRPWRRTALLVQGRGVLHLHRQGGGGRGRDVPEPRPGGLRDRSRHGAVLPVPPGQQQGHPELRRRLNRPG